MDNQNTFEADQAVAVISNNRFAFEYAAYQICNAFGLVWDGPQYGASAPSQLPPIVPPEPEPEPVEPEIEA